MLRATCEMGGAHGTTWGAGDRWHVQATAPHIAHQSSHANAIQTICVSNASAVLWHFKHWDSSLCLMRNRRGEKGSAQQAELIRYLHRQRDSLSQEVLRLQVLLERCGPAGQQCPVPQELQNSCNCLDAWLGPFCRAAGGQSCGLPGKWTSERSHAGVAAGRRPKRQSRQHPAAAMPRRRARRRRGHLQQQSCCAVRTAAPGPCWTSGSRPFSN